jgi:hypothetical protein
MERETGIEPATSSLGTSRSPVLLDSMDSKIQEKRYYNLERETGIEPATNGLGSRDSTAELLPLLPTILAR